MSLTYQNFTDEEKAMYDIVGTFILASYFLRQDCNFTMMELATCSYAEYLAKSTHKINENQFNALQEMLNNILN